MIAEIPERDASGAVARCYAEIRQKLQVPIVNLIWRHLAAIGELDHCWQRVEANLPEITMQGAAINTRARTLLAKLPECPMLELSDQALRIVYSYERGNSLNLATVRKLLGYPGLENHGSLPYTTNSLPPVPRFSDLAPELRSAIDQLGAAGPARLTEIRPTLWVHLAVDPALLRSAAQTLPPILISAAFRDAHRRLIGQPLPSTGQNSLPDAARAALQSFNQRISEMLLIGLHLAPDAPNSSGEHYDRPH